MRLAADEARYLVNRGYPKDSAIRFVCDHHRLPQAQRFVLTRIIVAATLAYSRRTKAQSLESLRLKGVIVDGYNVLITTESLLAGYSVYLCDDGFLRDTRGIFSSYKISHLTSPALSVILDLLAEAEPAHVEVLLDQQMSRSGELADLVRGMMAGRGLPGTARTAGNVDRLLKVSEAVVATSDGNVIDAAIRIYDLPREIAKRRAIVPLFVCSSAEEMDNFETRA
jgi:hypothetical protein